MKFEVLSFSNKKYEIMGINKLHRSYIYSQEIHGSILFLLKMDIAILMQFHIVVSKIFLLYDKFRR